MLYSLFDAAIDLPSCFLIEHINHVLLYTKMDLISDSDYIKIIDDGTNRSVVQREVHQLVPSLHFNILHFGHKVISVAEPFGPDTDVYILISLYIYSIRLLATENYISVLELE